MEQLCIDSLQTILSSKVAQQYDLPTFLCNQLYSVVGMLAKMFLGRLKLTKILLKLLACLKELPAFKRFSLLQQLSFPEKKASLFLQMQKLQLSCKLISLDKEESQRKQIELIPIRQKLIDDLRMVLLEAQFHEAETNSEFICHLVSSTFVPLSTELFKAQFELILCGLYLEPLQYASKLRVPRLTLKIKPQNSAKSITDNRKSPIPKSKQPTQHSPERTKSISSKNIRDLGLETSPIPRRTETKTSIGWTYSPTSDTKFDRGTACDDENHSVQVSAATMISKSVAGSAVEAANLIMRCSNRTLYHSHPLRFKIQDHRCKVKIHYVKQEGSR